MAFVLCAVISLGVIYHYYNDFFRREVENYYQNALINLSASMDDVFNEIYLSAGLLTRDAGFRTIITTDSPLIPNMIPQLISSVSTLRTFRPSKSYVDNAFLIDEPDNRIISGDGTVSIDVFFNVSSLFSDYPKTFWLNLPKANFLVLPPSVVANSSGTRRTVIPVVLRKLDVFTSIKTFVITLNADYFNSWLSEQQFTDNSILSMYGGDGQIFSENTPQETDYQISLQQIISKAPDGAEGKINVQTADLQGKQMLVMFLKKNVLGNSFVYSACIPFSDLYKKTDYIKNLTALVTVILLMLSFAISYVMGFSIYNPINKMLQALQRVPANAPGPTGEMDVMSDRLGYVLSNFDSARNELSALTPLAIEQLLYRLLNEQEWPSLHVENLVRDKCGFQYPGFIVSVFQLKWTDTFYKHFDKTERQNIINGVLKLLRETLDSSDCQNYLLPVEQNKVAVIFNIPENFAAEQVQTYFQELIDLFSMDMLYINWGIGIGSCQEGPGKIASSYRDAIIALSALSRYSKSRIRVYDNSLSALPRTSVTNQTQRIRYLLSHEDENKLNNYIINGMSENVWQLIEFIFEKNAGISEESKRELYNQVYLAGTRAAMRRGIEGESLLTADQRCLMDNYQKASLDEVAESVDHFYQNLFSLLGKADNKVNIMDVKAYIDARYTQDIYAENVADAFGITASYLSKLLKGALGMTLKQYISYIRIERSKELLSNTGKTIEEIAKLTGFNSRNTFIRMFEKMEGVSPTEYRRML